MTRPIYEPSTDRELAFQGYTGRQLQRRPAPTSARIIPWARFQRVSASDITVTSANNTVVSGTAGQDIITDTSIFQINSNNTIQMLVDGLVAIYGQTIWGTYTTSFRQVSVWEISGTDYPIAMDGSSDDLYDPVIVSGTVRLVAGNQLHLVVHQHSGGGQTLYGGGTHIYDTNFLEVQYLGPFGAP